MAVVGTLCLVFAPLARAVAQQTTAPVPLQGTLVRLEGTVFVKPDQAWDLGALLGGFRERWLLGGSISFAGADLDDAGTFYEAGLSGFANYFARLGPRTHVFVGPWVGFSAAKGGSTLGSFGGQAGLLVSLNSATAVRTEFSYRRSGGRSGTQLGVILDNFVTRGQGDAATPDASFPEVDVDAVAAYQFEPYRAYRLEGTVAPFLTSWAQIGGAATYDHLADFENDAHLFRGFARGYVSGSAAVRPFVEGIAESSTYESNDGGLSAYGGAVGLRHHLGVGAALDISLEWLGHPEQTFGLTHFRRRNDVQLRVRMLTRFRRARD